MKSHSSMSSAVAVRHAPRLTSSIQALLNDRAKVHPGKTVTKPERKPRRRLLSQAIQKANPCTKQRVFIGLISWSSILWTLWLLLLTIKPNESINWIMKTEHFDNGTFWRMIDPSKTTMWFSSCGLMVAVTAYASVLMQLFRRQNRVTQASNWSLSKRIDAVTAGLRTELLRNASYQNGGRIRTFLGHSVVSLMQDNIQAVQIVRVWVKFADLAVESAILYQTLEAGSPLVLVRAFAFVIGMNALSCVLMMLLPDSLSGLTEVFVDIFFDFAVVVVYPLLGVAYCLSTFSLDRIKIAISLEIFPVGWFERNASVIANPVQTDIFYKALKSLQIFSLMDFCLRIGVHLVFSYRLYRVAELVQRPRKRQFRLYPKRHLSSIAALIGFVVAMIIFVEKSVYTSALACQLHPECAVKAHRWITVEKGNLTQCPCLTVIDGNHAPKTFEEWIQPKDVTLKIIQLATTGDLRTIQLTNRYFPIFPEELRACRHLRHLSLVYTSTESLPSWVKDFVEMEYLYVEGTFTNSLVELPDDMFDDMSSLTFIHLGMHRRLSKLPSFNGLVSLKTLTLAVFTSLIELPAFDNLHNLERLVLSFVPAIDVLPDLKSLQKLKAFSVNDRGAWCCNGFLKDCDLKDFFCAAQPFWGIPRASCLSPITKASTDTLAIVDKFATTVCTKQVTNSPGPGFPTQENIAQCNGILYRKCSLPGFKEAMCFNARFMVIFCSQDTLIIEMRRRQIQLGVGDTCNPEYEGWLGMNWMTSGRHRALYSQRGRRRQMHFPSQVQRQRVKHASPPRSSHVAKAQDATPWYIVPIGDDDESQDIRVLQLERKGARKIIEADAEAKPADLLSKCGDKENTQSSPSRKRSLEQQETEVRDGRSKRRCIFTPMKKTRQYNQSLPAVQRVKDLGKERPPSSIASGVDMLFFNDGKELQGKNQRQHPARSVASSSLSGKHRSRLSKRVVENGSQETLQAGRCQQSNYQDEDLRSYSRKSESQHQSSDGESTSMCDVQIFRRGKEYEPKQHDSQLLKINSGLCLGSIPGSVLSLSHSSTFSIGNINHQASPPSSPLEASPLPFRMSRAGVLQSQLSARASHTASDPLESRLNFTPTPQSSQSPSTSASSQGSMVLGRPPLGWQRKMLLSLREETGDKEENSLPECVSLPFADDFADSKLYAAQIPHSTLEDPLEQSASVSSSRDGSESIIDAVVPIDAKERIMTAISSQHIAEDSRTWFQREAMTSTDVIHVN
ncbi:Reticulon-4 receptor [Phytophthora citrophthora]|uniref:Reticulon-4 receptor n=1 Tax=Phytophthora citrophthora TaxID=4793 RepID=A0AAD9GIA9_9STRA|nr:Reticulon-4 receptor [Phytophthora citrophthora]